MPRRHEAIKWNPFNKVVQDHRTGHVHPRLTDAARRRAGLPTPWKPESGNVEVHQPPVHVPAGR